MGQPFVGEIRMFAGTFNPNGWMFCSGALLPIAEYEVLFNLIGTTYGGDGVATFALPNLQGSLPLHVGTGPGPAFILGETGGTEEVTLTTQQIPAHSHPLQATNASPQLSPSNANPAVATSTQVGVMVYGNPGGNPSTTLHPSTVQIDGNSQPHNNMQPYLCINFIISLFGIFPTQN